MKTKTIIIIAVLLVITAIVAFFVIKKPKENKEVTDVKDERVIDPNEKNLPTMVGGKGSFIPRKVGGEGSWMPSEKEKALWAKNYEPKIQ
jgi:flagellar basal body-associated protein FliL